MAEQQVILVNTKNKIIGFEDKMTAHQTGKLHRAFSIFIFNSKGELLIQQRAVEKYHSGSLWSNTVCSHPMPNETYRQAIHRRLKEEMGFDCKLKKLFWIIYRIDLPNTLIEHEYNCVYVGKFDGHPIPNPEEIMNLKWITLKELKRQLKNHPHQFSAWLKIILKKMAI